MRDLNSVIAEGNLVADPQSKSVGPSAKTVCVFTIAMNGIRRNKEGEEKQEQTETVFLDVECWATLADRCAQYLKKGSSVEVYGSLTVEIREKDGKTYTNVNIMADRVGFYGFRKKEDKDVQDKKE